MENNQRNSRKRLNSLILLVAFTAVMLIVSTYAWFSSQKNVTIGNLEGTVNVAEGLRVSLDAKNWAQEIDLKNPVLDSGFDMDTPYTDGSNNRPSEMLPVSTTGVEDIDTNTEMTFYNGVTVTNTYTGTTSVDLHSIIASDITETSATELDYPGYFAIDLFLENSSKTTGTAGSEKETLQLNTNSLLKLLSTGTAELTGLQNTVRAALAMYTPIAGTDFAGDSSASESVAITATQTQILAAYNGAKISDIAIWEPNSTSHVESIVTQYANSTPLTWNSAIKTLYNITGTSFTATDKLPTYALTSGSTTASETVTGASATGGKIQNIYDWNDGSSTTVTTIANSGLERQIALQTTTESGYSIYDGGVRNLISVTSSGEAVYELGNETGAVTFDMIKNSIVKCRLYVWLEGQDVDCLNTASHGGGIHLDLGLVKGATPGQQAS